MYRLLITNIANFQINDFDKEFDVNSHPIVSYHIWRNFAQLRNLAF